MFYCRYIIDELDGTNPINFGPLGSWMLKIQGAYFQDLFQQKWNNITTPPDVNELDDLTVDTSVPRALYVDSTDPDGTYYPGQSLYIYVEFDKPVLITPPLPALGLRLAFQAEHMPFDIPEKNLLANYQSGNLTSTVFFRYDIPAVLVGFRSEFTLVRLEYLQTNSLAAYSKGLIRSVAPGAISGANLYLPTSTESRFVTTRKINIEFSPLKVKKVYALEKDGIYTAGDEIKIAVEFTSPVMVLKVPPVLRLETGEYDRDAIFHSGK